MERYSTWRGLSTYSVTPALIRDVASYIDTGIPPLLNSGGNYSVPSLSAHTTLTIYGSENSSVYTPAAKYAAAGFPNDIQYLTIELYYRDEGRLSPTGTYRDFTDSSAIVLLLKLGQAKEDTEVYVALQDRRAEEKTKALIDGLLKALGTHRNRNRVAYPNDFMPTLVFVAGFLIGLGGLMLTNQLLRSFCIFLFGTAIYFVACRFTRGYCSFASSRQQRLDTVLHWITGAVALFVLAMLFFPLWK